MVAIKAGEAEAFSRSPPPAVQAALVYGSDPGMVSERSATIAKAFAARRTPQLEILRIDDTDLETDVDRLIVELTTVSMFSDGKVVRTTASRKVTAQLLEPILDPSRLAASLVVESGNLKPDDKLRKLFEKPSFAMAIPCYADGTRDLSVVIDEVLGATGQRIDADARELLLARLGADRALSRNEVEKLALYAHGETTISADHVAEIVGDASELTLDRIVIAAADGNTAAASIEYHRALASGVNAQLVILAMLNHIQRLHRIRAEMDTGKSFDDATRRLRPPIHFKQKTAIVSQCRYWSIMALSRAIAVANSAARAARLNTLLEEALAEKFLADIADIAATAKRR